MIKCHSKSHGSSIIITTIDFFRERISPQSFFSPEIRLFFQFVWNYRQQGILQNLALVHGTGNLILSVFSVVSPWIRCGWKLEGFLISFTFLWFMSRQRCFWNSHISLMCFPWCCSLCFCLEIPFKHCPRTIPGKQRCDLGLCQCCWEHLSMPGNFLGNRIYWFIHTNTMGEHTLINAIKNSQVVNPLELQHQNNTGSVNSWGLETHFFPKFLWVLVEFFLDLCYSGLVC